jgi:hypothetical protein
MNAQEECIKFVSLSTPRENREKGLKRKLHKPGPTNLDPHTNLLIVYIYIYSRLSIIRAWFNRFAAQPRRCIFKKKFIFREYHICLNVLYASQC